MYLPKNIVKHDEMEKYDFNRGIISEKQKKTSIAIFSKS